MSSARKVIKMALINVRDLGGGGGTNMKKIVEDGTLNPNYFLSGNLVQKVGYIELTRVGASDDSGFINTIDFSKINTLAVNAEISGTSDGLAIKINGTNYYQSGQATGTRTLRLNVDVSAVTGVHQLQVQCYGNVGTIKLFDVIGG